MPLFDAADLVAGSSAACQMLCGVISGGGSRLWPKKIPSHIGWGAGWSVYAQADHINNSSRLTFKSPLGMKLKSLKEVEKFLLETANSPRVPAKGALVEAEMTDEHTKKTEWVQGTITKVLAGPKTGSFRVEFKVENAEEKGSWEETYKVFFFLCCASSFASPSSAASHSPSCSRKNLFLCCGSSSVPPQRGLSFSILQPPAHNSRYVNALVDRGGYRVALAAAGDRCVQGERTAGYRGVSKGFHNAKKNCNYGENRYYITCITRAHGRLQGRFARFS